jgi:hypothetical protein
MSPLTRKLSDAASPALAAAGSVSTVRGTVIALLPEFQQVHLETDDGREFALTTDTDGVDPGSEFQRMAAGRCAAHRRGRRKGLWPGALVPIACRAGEHADGCGIHARGHLRRRWPADRRHTFGRRRPPFGLVLRPEPRHRSPSAQGREPRPLPRQLQATWASRTRCLRRSCPGCRRYTSTRTRIGFIAAPSWDWSSRKPRACC